MRSTVNVKQSGFSLVESIVAQAITVITLLALAGFYVYANAKSKDLEASAAIIDRMQELRYAFSRKGCSANLRTTALDIANPAGTSIPELRFADAAGNLTELLLKQGVSVGGATPTQIQLIPIAQMSLGRYAAKLEVRFERIGGAVTVRTLNLLADVQGGQVLDCWAYQNPSETIANDMCTVLTSANLNEFDTTTGLCELRNGQWEISDNPFTARCPAGTQLNPFATTGYTCKVQVPATFSDPLDLDDTPLTNGMSTDLTPDPYMYFLDVAAGQCECAYGTDIPAEDIAEFRCMIRCVRP